MCRLRIDYCSEREICPQSVERNKQKTTAAATKGEPVFSVPVDDSGHGLLRALGSVSLRRPLGLPSRRPLGLLRGHFRDAALGAVVQRPERVVPPAKPGLVLERFHRRHARCDHQ
ncbi:hypothetical protein ZIOFF_023809 [Zingiber officinale]|uniref:Uncharacterized protein n=1 Tax=Zingiber officinale TaxID=94328 RepID=A0A8J5H1F0_ZINOF|nr:hypothetical protein ZIOFF_023809 [Zingiber officinale]